MGDGIVRYEYDANTDEFKMVGEMNSLSNNPFFKRRVLQYKIVGYAISLFHDGFDVMVMDKYKNGKKLAHRKFNNGQWQ